ncbi:MAG: T9SS type A sorting domain-containing protein [Schleiferiaceae bacterium]|jgi:hypothetical protein|nr:T9SS type A sorting domain-containing protein [Schleiferiaceae bacterium]
MKKLATLLFLLLSITSFAQNYQYHPFPKQTGYWKYIEKDWQWIWTGNWINEEYKAQGDTLYSPGEGAYYEKNKRIYYRYDTSSVFKVLYDFNLTLGDTFVNPFYESGNPYWTDSMAVVTLEDSSGLSFGFYGRRTLYLDGQPWIEGIGNPSYHGIKHNLHPGSLSGGWEFKCLYYDGQSVPCQNAYILGEEKEYSIQPKLFPNPTHNKLILKNLPVDSQLEIFDVMGVNLTHQVTIDGEELDVSRLKPGTYLLKLSGANGATFKRFVKE